MVQGELQENGGPGSDLAGTSFSNPHLHQMGVSRERIHVFFLGPVDALRLLAGSPPRVIFAHHA